MTNVIKIELNNEMKGESAKALREQAYYLSPHVSNVDVEGKSITIEFFNEIQDLDDIKKSVINISDKINSSFRRTKNQVLFSINGCGKSTDDPLSFLNKNGNLKKHGPGVFTFQGNYGLVIRALDNFFRNYALSIGAEEQLYPPTVMTKNMLKNGYLKSFPHHVLFVSGVYRDIENVSLLEHQTSDGVNIDPSYLDKPDQMLAPTVCYRCFEAMSNTKFENIALFTGTAHCNRNEGFIDDDLTRLQSFLMREIVFMGTPPEVESIRQKIVSHSREVVGEWGLSAKLTTASDPFFAVDAKSKRSYQTLMNLKYELQFHLPYNDKWLSCVSFNNHQSSLVTPYNISGASDEMTSGCVGYGFDRLALAIFAQHGEDIHKWPLALREIVID